MAHARTIVVCARRRSSFAGRFSCEELFEAVGGDEGFAGAGLGVLESSVPAEAFDVFDGAVQYGGGFGGCEPVGDGLLAWGVGRERGGWGEDEGVSFGDAASSESPGVGEVVDVGGGAA